MGIIESFKRGWNEGYMEGMEKRYMSCANCEQGTGTCKYCKNKDQFKARGSGGDVMSDNSSSFGFY